MGTIKLDTITGLSTASEVTIASNKFVGTASGTMSVVGEGGSNTTNIQQGLAKYWQNLDTTGTAEQRDSFNVSGITDNNTGDITTAFTTNFGNAYYSVTSMGGRSGGTASFFIRFNDNVTAPTASAVRFQFIDADGSGTDGDRATTAGHGDLS